MFAPAFRYARTEVSSALNANPPATPTSLLPPAPAVALAVNVLAASSAAITFTVPAASVPVPPNQDSVRRSATLIATAMAAPRLVPVVFSPVAVVVTVSVDWDLTLTVVAVCVALESMEAPVWTFSTPTATAPEIVMLPSLVLALWLVNVLKELLPAGAPGAELPLAPPGVDAAVVMTLRVLMASTFSVAALTCDAPVSAAVVSVPVTVVTATAAPAVPTTLPLALVVMASTSLACSVASPVALMPALPSTTRSAPAVNAPLSGLSSTLTLTMAASKLALVLLLPGCAVALMTASECACAVSAPVRLICAVPPMCTFGSDPVSTSITFTVLACAEATMFWSTKASICASFALITEAPRMSTRAELKLVTSVAERPLLKKLSPSSLTSTSDFDSSVTVPPVAVSVALLTVTVLVASASRPFTRPVLLAYAVSVMFGALITEAASMVIAESEITSNRPPVAVV